MSIYFKCPIWSRSLFIFTMGLSTMWLAFGYKEVAADNKTAALESIQQTAGNASKVLVDNENFSRADLLGIKEEDSCQEKENEDQEEKSGQKREQAPKEDFKEAVGRIKVILTAYSSTIAQTDSTPFITANGTYVHDGVVANNGLPFGTEIRIPEIYGDKVFSVEDRMHRSKGNYYFDIWFPTYEQAKNFGVKYAYVEVLGK